MPPTYSVPRWARPPSPTRPPRSCCQAPQVIDEIAETFGLSAGEKQLLLAAERGQGLLCAGQQRVAFQSLASPREDALITTDPAQLAQQDERDEFTDSFVDLDDA